MAPNYDAPRRVFRAGAWRWLFEDGQSVPVVSGGDGPVTVEDLLITRAQGLDAIDDIIRTAQAEGRGLTATEQADHDYLVAHCDAIEGQVEAVRSTEHAGARAQEQEARRSWSPGIAPNVNRISVAPPAANRSLDEVLWASSEVVRTTSFGGHSAVNPIEQTIVRSQNGDYVAAPRLHAYVPEQHDLIRSFQSLVSEMCIFGCLMSPSGKVSSAAGFELARASRQYKDRWNYICRAMDVDTSAQGTEWVPTGIGSSLHEKVRAQGKVAPLFMRINLPTNPWKMPIEGTDATAYRVAEPTADNESKMTASTPGTVAVTFDAEIFGSRVLSSRSLDADSAIAMVPFIERKLVYAFVTAEEQAILDGDTDGTHQDSDVGASTTDARTAWDGLRKKAIAQTVVTATTSTVANLFAIRAGMGKWGADPANLAYIVGMSALHDVMADSNVLTVDKMGPQATILNGQIGSVGGVPIIASEHVRENLNASGVYDGITTTKTYNLCVNRNEWVMGQRMALDIETDDSIYRETFQRVAVAFMREDFQCVGDAATNEDTAIAYNVTP